MQVTVKRSAATLSEEFIQTQTKHNVATTEMPDTAVAAGRSKTSRSRLWYDARKINHWKHKQGRLYMSSKKLTETQFIF